MWLKKRHFYNLSKQGSHLIICRRTMRMWYIGEHPTLMAPFLEIVSYLLSPPQLAQPTGC